MLRRHRPTTECHDCAVLRRERDSAYNQLEHLRAEYRNVTRRNDRLRGENRDLLARLYDFEHPKTDRHEKKGA